MISDECDVRGMRANGHTDANARFERYGICGLICISPQ